MMKKYFAKDLTPIEVAVAGFIFLAMSFVYLMVLPHPSLSIFEPIACFVMAIVLWLFAIYLHRSKKVDKEE